MAEFLIVAVYVVAWFLSVVHSLWLISNTVNWRLVVDFQALLIFASKIHIVVAYFFQKIKSCYGNFKKNKQNVLIINSIKGKLIQQSTKLGTYFYLLVWGKLK